MYSRITNMNRIEDFGTISSKTKLNISHIKKDYYHFFFTISNFLHGQVRRWGGGGGGGLG